MCHAQLVLIISIINIYVYSIGQTKELICFALNCGSVESWGHNLHDSWCLLQYLAPWPVPNMYLFNEVTSELISRHPSGPRCGPGVPRVLTYILGRKSAAFSRRQHTLLL